MEGSDSSSIMALAFGVIALCLLAYIALKLRRSASAGTSGNAQAGVKQFTDISLAIAEPENSRAFARGLRGIDNLETSERVSFFSMLTAVTRSLESLHYQSQRGEVDTRLYDGCMTQFLDLCANPGVRDFWSLRKHQYSRDFAEHVESKAGSHTAQPLYSAPEPAPKVAPTAAAPPPEPAPTASPDEAPTSQSGEVIVPEAKPA